MNNNLPAGLPGMIAHHAGQYTMSKDQVWRRRRSGYYGPIIFAGLAWVPVILFLFGVLG